MTIITTVEFNVTDAEPKPSKTLANTTSFTDRFSTHYRELRDLLKFLEQRGSIEKPGRYTLTYSDPLSYGLAYFPV